jgi:glycosyltransferase involved in cell wall biosynthesis
MKVLHLDTGRTWRGGQAQVVLLMRGLRERGHESVLLSPPGPLAERARSLGFAWEPWRVLGDWDPLARIACGRALARVAPAIAHAHSAHAHAVGAGPAHRARVPFVVSRRVDFRVATNPLSARKYRLPVDRYLAISTGVREVLRAAGIPEAKLALVPSGIELPDPAEAAAAPDLRAELGLKAATPLLGTVAALAPHKDHATLLEAAAIVCAARPDVHFVWIGEGECRAALERRRGALTLDSRVHLLGFRPGARALIPQFTLFVLSSYLEGLCTSLLDAQALGTPIVATATGGIPDVVADGATGRLVPPRDPRALAAALLEALAEPAARASWVERARTTVRAFEWHRTAERTLEVYRQVLHERGFTDA